MPHGVVSRVVVQGAQHAVMLVKRPQHGRGDRALAQCFGADIVDLLHRRFNIHP